MSPGYGAPGVIRKQLTKSTLKHEELRREAEEARQEELRGYEDLLSDPVRFCAVCWPDIRLYDKQVEILRSVDENLETFAHAGNELGKDFIAAICAIWFFASRKPAKVVTSSSSETQLKSILWSEINQRLDTSRIKFPFRRTHLRLERKIPGGGDDDVDPLSYVIGQVTTKPENIQGHHLVQDKPRTLAIFDEASGIPDPFFDAADSWAHRKLVIGNPLSTTNFFYRLTKLGNVKDPAGAVPYLRKIIHISGEDSPNVILGKQLVEEGIPGPYPTLVPGVVSYEDYLRRLEKWDDIKLETRLYGRFWEGRETLLFPAEWLNRAEKISRGLKNTKRVARSMGVDTAEGGDKSCWTVVDEYGIIDQVAFPTRDTMEIPTKTIALMHQYALAPDQVSLDRGGGGKQIADYLRRQGYAVRTVGFGESPTDPRRLDRYRRRLLRLERRDIEESKYAYKNRRAEMYGLLRSDLLDPSYNEQGFGIPAHLTELRRQLAPLPLLYDGEGRMYLPSKDKRNQNSITEVSLRDLLGCSPDEADSLVLAVYGMLIRPYKRTLGGLG